MTHRRHGVVAIANDTRTTSPEEIARSAGWRELDLGARRVQIPVDQISSARATVDVVPDGEPGSSAAADDAPLPVIATVSLLEYLVWCRCCR